MHSQAIKNANQQKLIIPYYNWEKVCTISRLQTLELRNLGECESTGNYKKAFVSSFKLIY